MLTVVVGTPGIEGDVPEVTVEKLRIYWRQLMSKTDMAVRCHLSVCLSVCLIKTSQTETFIALFITRSDNTLQ